MVARDGRSGNALGRVGRQRDGDDTLCLRARIGEKISLVPSVVVR